MYTVQLKRDKIENIHYNFVYCTDIQCQIGFDGKGDEAIANVE